MPKYTEFKYNNGGYTYKWASLVTIVEAEKLSLYVVLVPYYSLSFSSFHPQK